MGWGACSPNLQYDVLDGGGAADDASVMAPVTSGNIIHYTFDDSGGQIIRDRSRRHQHGFRASGSIVGDALDGIVRVWDHPDLTLGNQMTLEARITPTVAQPHVILSDRNLSTSPPVEIELVLAMDGTLEFWTNNCTDDTFVATTDPVGVPLDVESYIAFVWDGQSASFYLDGNLIEAVPFSATACALDDRTLYIGSDRVENSPFAGQIDDIKISKLRQDGGTNRGFVRPRSPD